MCDLIERRKHRAYKYDALNAAAYVGLVVIITFLVLAAVFG